MVDVVCGFKAAKDRLEELPDKTVATILPTTAIREYAPGNLSQSDHVIKFPVQQQPSIAELTLA